MSGSAGGSVTVVVGAGVHVVLMFAFRAKLAMARLVEFADCLHLQ